VAAVTKNNNKAHLSDAAKGKSTTNQISNAASRIEKNKNVNIVEVLDRCMVAQLSPPKGTGTGSVPLVLPPPSPLAVPFSHARIFEAEVFWIHGFEPQVGINLPLDVLLSVHGSVECVRYASYSPTYTLTQTLTPHQLLVPKQVRDYLTTCVIGGGGARSMVLCDSVTKVVLGPKAHAK
jgi:hypothetical protein